jgi:lipopolysaccharide/colanic/teichoic acid biosynthesis glycosyltransferase
MDEDRSTDQRRHGIMGTVPPGSKRAEFRPFAIEAHSAEQSEPALLRLAGWIYRVAEISAAFTALVLSSPILLIIAILIRIDSPGPAIFWHRRAGQSELRLGRHLAGRTDLKAQAEDFDPNKKYYVPTEFSFPKFRTMYRDAAEKYPEYYWWNYDLTQEQLGKMYYKLEEDPRITKLGKWLRKTTLDELPNLWSVVKCDIRLVGPRPEAFELLHNYSDEQMLKFTVKPGVTCLSKIYGRGGLSFQEQVAWDLEYVRTRSLGLDLKILALTLLQVVRGKGAF